MASAAPAEPLPILVVDDDSALIRTLADILRLHGYSPSTAETGEEGLAIAEHESPALAVVDLRLPDMDGMELAARLHALSEITEVVVLTGNASVESAVAALRENSVDYLLKPVNVDQLLQVASLATERWQRRRAEERLRQSDRISQQALEVRARQQAVVASLGQRAIVNDDLQALFNEAVHLVATTLDMPFASVSERKSDGISHVLRAAIGWPESEIGKAQEALVDPSHVSGVNIVIPGPTQPFGVLGVNDVRTRELSTDDAHFLQAIAHILGTSIERSRTDRAYRQAQRLEAVGRLASGVAHDFNNMLTAITGYGELVQAKLAADDPIRSDVDEILKAAVRAAGLTRQLLAFSRQQVLQPRMVMLNEVVTGMGKMLERILGADIKVTVTLDQDLGLVKADPGQIEQVLLNLCVNARDAMPEGGTLTIETCNAALDMAQTLELSVDAPGDYVMLAVTDTGVGMDQETKARIFEPFFTTKAPEEGTGLGLATVYGIVKQSGGEIWVYSEQGRGSTFKVFLPRLADGSGEPVQQQRTAAMTPTGSETILLAEDEDSIKRVATRILERAGYTVISADNGADALKVAESHQGDIDLLVTDMMMPRMNGVQLAQHMRALRPGLRTLFLSGYTDSTVVRQGPLDPSEHFLQKPFASETLVAKVREVLDAPDPPTR